MGTIEISDHSTAHGGRLRVIAIARPDRRNAVDMVMREELRAVIDQVRSDGELRACIITGAGGNFCAGGDISTMRDREPGIEDARTRMRRTGEFAVALATLDKPLIAAVEGAAFGAGFGIAMTADFVLAAPSAVFCASFAKIGLVPDLALHYSLPRIVGLARAKEIVFSARSIQADEAVRLGLIHRIVDASSLIEAARELAERFLEASPTALALSKSLLQQSHALDIRQIAEGETAAQAIALETAYHRQAAARFLNREKPRFEWNEMTEREP